MTNAEKYKTAEERQSNFNKFCKQYVRCLYCPLGHSSRLGICRFKWLDLEYKEELKPCPFCGGRAVFHKTLVEGSTCGWVQCTYCGVNFITKEKDEVIAAWNRRVK